MMQLKENVRAPLRDLLINVEVTVYPHTKSGRWVYRDQLTYLTVNAAGPQSMLILWSNTIAI